jgi:hypothetical protein
MPAQVDPNLGLNHSYSLGESGWHLGYDANWKKLGAVVQLSIIDRNLSAPPASPALGARYIVGQNPTGAWANKADHVAVWTGSWVFYPPVLGWVAYVQDEDVIAAYVLPGLWNAGLGAQGPQGPQGIQGIQGPQGVQGPQGDPSAPLVINAQTGTTYTITASDIGKTITLNNASAITVTVPETATEALPAGFWCTLLQRGAGQVTVAKQGTDTIESRGGYLKLSGQHAAATVTKLVAGTPNVYSLVGDLVP